MNFLEEIKWHKQSLLRGNRKIERVLLFRIPTINYKEFDIEANRRSRVCTQQPIGIAMLASYLREELPNIELKLVDLEYDTVVKMFESSQKENVLENCTKAALAKFNPDLVGISVVFSPSIRNGYNVAQIVKDFNPEIVVAFGGVHCTFDYKNILTQSHADAVFLKEAEYNFVNYIKCLNEELEEDSVHGVTFLNQQKEVAHIPYTSTPNFETLPMPAWDMVDTQNYYKVATTTGINLLNFQNIKPYGIIQTVRGCIARCTFCSVRNFNGFRVRHRSPEKVLDEIDILYHKYGVRFLEIVDDDFSYDHDRAIAICQGLIKRKYDLIWCLANGIRLMTITEELAENLVASGCRLIAVGVESGNKDILHKIKKPLTLPGLYKKMEMMKKYPEIYIRGNFIVGFPFENYDQLEDTFRVASEVAFDWKAFSMYSPLVGTEALNYYDGETQDEINYYENSYQKIESIPDGYKTEEDFKNRVYYENLKVNFLENPNYKGRDLPRALNDFLKIVECVDQDHAVALYCISEIHKKLNNNEKHIHYKTQYDQSLSASEDWRYFCGRLNLPQLSYTEVG